MTWKNRCVGQCLWAIIGISTDIGRLQRDELMMSEAVRAYLSQQQSVEVEDDFS